MSDVSEIADEDLIRRAVRSFKTVKRGYGRPRWAAVSELFGLGSTYSQQLCRRFDLDPDEGVRK